jgi:hypothetical protein
MVEREALGVQVLIGCGIYDLAGVRPTESSGPRNALNSGTPFTNPLIRIVGIEGGLGFVLVVLPARFVHRRRR